MNITENVSSGTPLQARADSKRCCYKTRIVDGNGDDTIPK